jgi:hypothetical protein
MIFNDNSKNYSESGEFISNDIVRSTNFSRRRNAVALVEIDLISGNIYRKSMIKQKELNSIILPKLFSVDQEKKQLLLYAISGGKERFGYLNFK